MAVLAAIVDFVLELDNSDLSVARLALIVSVGLVLAGAGLVAVVTGAERLGVIVVGAGAWLVERVLNAIHTGSTATAAYLAAAIWVALVAHAILTYPSGRLASRVERIVVVAGYFIAVGLRLLDVLVALAGHGANPETQRSPACSYRRHTALDQPNRGRPDHRLGGRGHGAHRRQGVGRHAGRQAGAMAWSGWPVRRSARRHRHRRRGPGDLGSRSLRAVARRSSPAWPRSRSGRRCWPLGWPSTDCSPSSPTSKPSGRGRRFAMPCAVARRPDPRHRVPAGGAADGSMRLARR